jgi:hypothetical protein
MFLPSFVEYNNEFLIKFSLLARHLFSNKKENVKCGIGEYAGLWTMLFRIIEM